MDLHLQDVAPVHISIRELTVRVKEVVPTFERLRRRFRRSAQDPEKVEQPFQEIIHEISADIPAGSLTAIIGASGSGKTTLLNTISHRVSSQKLEIFGSTKFNGSTNLRSIRSAYLMQQDILLPTLSVRETLDYAAGLRLPSPNTTESRKLMVERVIGELGLKDCANTRIGSHEHKGCSGGERRRTSIGVQLLANPSILFCDEPTTGLDAHSAFQIIQTLKKLAEMGRTIVLSIHSPRSEIWNLFDNVLLLSHGHTLYSGPAHKAIPYFSECGYDLAPFVNPAEFLIDLAGIDNRSEEAENMSSARVLELKNVWKQRCISEKLLKQDQPDGIDLLVEENAELRRLKVGFKEQVFVLTKRTTKVTMRDPMGIFGSLFEAVIMSIVSGLIFFQLGSDQAGIRSREGALYTASSQQAYLILMFETYRLTLDIKVFDRERSEGVVTVPAFLLSRRISRLFLEDLPVPAIFSIIFYFMVGFRADVATFFTFLGIMIVLQFITIGLATVCVAVSRDFAIASLIGNTAYTLQTLGCGYFVQSQQIPVWTRWLKWTAFTFYIFGGLTANEFIGPDGGYLGQFYDCPFSNDPKSFLCQQYTGRYIMNSLGFPPNWIWRPIIASLSFAFLFFFLAWAILTYWTHDIDVAKARKSEEEPGMDLQILRSAENLPPIAISLEKFELSVSRHRLLQPKVTKAILRPITAVFEAGKINAIMGPSGSGKTSLLQSLAKRLQNTWLSSYCLSGTIRINGITSSTNTIKSIASFVMQDDDALMPALTVRETLRFAAGLRLPSSMSKEEKRQRADEVIVKMGLKNCADNVIGNDIRKGISGGEKRRVSMAIQILTNPKVLLLDEPTSGLDAYTASSVMDVLRMLASEGRTILVTIHQPRSDIYQKFDNIVLLAPGGANVYAGEAKAMLSHFRELGYECPPTTNPADFVLDLISVDLQRAENERATRERVQRFIQRWDEKPPASLTANDQTYSTPAFQSLKKEMSPFRIVFPYVLRRSYLNITRTPEIIIARTMQIVGITLIFALFFSPLQTNQEAIQSRMGLVQETAALYFIGMLQNIASYPSERDVFSREHSDNIYNVSTFILTYTILEIPFEIASSLFFGALLAFATNLDRSPLFFLIAALNCFCVISCGESVGIVFCTLFSHTGFALNITSVFLTIATIMAGVISLDIPRWLQALNHLSPLKYEVANMAVYSMRGRKFTCAAEQMVEGVCPIATGEDVLKLYRLDKNPGLNLMAFGITTVVYRLIAWGVLLVVYARRKHAG